MCVVTKESNPELYNALFPEDEIKEINIKWPGQILDYVDTKEHLLELFKYITNLKKENEILNKGIMYAERIEQDYKTKFDKILEQIKIVEDADLSEYNFCKFIDKIKSIIQGSDKE